MSKVVATKKPMTKTQILTSLAESTELTKKQVSDLLEALVDLVQKSLSARGAGSFTLPGLLKIERKKVPARPAKKDVRNPFTGEMYDQPAKPASVTVKVRALKKLKDMV